MLMMVRAVRDPQGVGFGHRTGKNPEMDLAANDGTSGAAASRLQSLSAERRPGRHHIHHDGPPKRAAGARR